MTDDLQIRQLAKVLEDDETRETCALPTDLEATAGEQRALRHLLGKASREDPGPAFTAALMTRLPDMPGSWYRHLGSWLWAPRVMHLRWNLAAVGLVVVVVALAAIYLLRSAPESGPRSVTLVFVAPQAKTVAVAGDFNSWQPARQPMRDESGGGVWTTTLKLAPGRYEYMFVVNGEKWVADPLARVRRPDGFGRENAVIDL